MKTLLSAFLVGISAGALGAQEPGTPATLPAPVGADSIPVDRVVAVVGASPILWSDVLEGFNAMRAQGRPLPQDSVAQMELAREIVQRLVDEELLIQKARELKIEVADADVSAQVEQRVKQARDQFPDEAAMRAELRRAGFGSIEEWRRFLTEQARRQAMQQKLFEQLRRDGKLPPVPVTDAEVTAYFERARAQVPRLPATVQFDQIVVSPRPDTAAKLAARAKAESLLVEIERGGDFQQIAKRESMDPGSRELGGDLGWRRRGDFVPEFERWAFNLRPGRVSPVVETTFGYHLILVDRTTPAEVKVRHILIRPTIDSTDAARARERADSVAQAVRNGANWDALSRQYHDPAEERGTPQPFPREQLPQPYQQAFAGATEGQVVIVELPDAVRGVPKYAVARVVDMEEAREGRLEDFREQIRQNLQQEKAYRRYLENLRAQSFVAVRL